MRVSSLDSDGDWTFGKGRANYKRDSKAISQNVSTRLKSFTDDWFLDVDAGISWIDLLGKRGTERRITRAIEKTVLQTDGVREIKNIQITSMYSKRNAKIELNYFDVFGNTNSEKLALTL